MTTTTQPRASGRTPLTVTAFDLDRTLIFSRASAGDPAALPPMRVVEHLDGAPQSFMTHASWDRVASLMNEAFFVPVTTRTQRQYEAISLPEVPRYAICANGGVLLVDGVRDTDWSAWVQDTVSASAPLRTIVDLLAKVSNEAWVTDVDAAEDLFCYLVATSRKDIPGKWLRSFTQQVTALGWTVSVQGRKVYAVPEGLSKATGLMRLRDLLDAAHDGDVRVYASGDSLLDAPMLEAADEAIRPAHGELHDTGWTADGVEVTTETGALAGQEIVGWMLDRAQQD